MQVNQVSSVKANPNFGFKMNKKTVEFLKDAFGDGVVDSFKKAHGNDVKFQIKEMIGVVWGEVSKGRSVRRTEGFLSNDLPDFFKVLKSDKLYKMGEDVSKENQQKGILTIFDKVFKK